MRPRATLLTTLLLLAALGCAKTTGAGSVLSMTPTQSGTPPTQTDLASYFKPFPAGAFVLYDLKRDRYVRYDEARCRERVALTKRILKGLGHLKN